MKPTSLFLGACALACVAGAVGGMTTNTVPIDRAGIGDANLGSRPQFAAFGQSPAPVVLTPDRYALDTPTGRIEVAELANHGLYSQERFGFERAAFDQPAETALEQVATLEPENDAMPEPLDLIEPAEPQSTYARTIEFPAEAPTGI